MKYYKITNKEECHYGMQYKTGLNEDVLPFNPSGSCEEGGIYFAREDILAFIDYGPWIREVTLPEGEEVYENPGKLKKWKAHRVILGERRKITMEVIEELINEGANVHAGNDWALRWASANGHYDIVKLLLEYGADVHANNDCALQWASRNGHIEIVKLLLDHGADVHADGDHALRWASINGHVEVVKLLLEHGADVHADDDHALRK